jgi:hypothetical protein
MFGSLGSENSQFNFPHGVAVTKRGEIIVADTGNGRIQVYTLYIVTNNVFSIHQTIVYYKCYFLIGYSVVNVVYIP